MKHVNILTDDSGLRAHVTDMSEAEARIVITAN